MKPLLEYLLDKHNKAKDIYKNYPVQMGMDKTSFVKYLYKLGFSNTTEDPEWDPMDIDEFKVKGNIISVWTCDSELCFHVFFKNQKLDRLETVDLDGNIEDAEIEDFIDYLLP